MNALKLLLFTLILCLLTSCSSIQGIFGKNASKEQKQLTKVESLEKEQSVNSQNKLTQISSFAFATKLSLNTSTNKEEPPILFALSMNDRIMSLSPSPSINDINEMSKLFNDYLLNKSEYKRELAKKDVEIETLQKKDVQLKNEWNKEIDRYKELATNTALKADTLKAELDDYQGWLGLKAVGKGLWQFTKSSMWILSIGSVLFIILRMFASSNPIAGAIFSVLSVIGGYIIRIINVIIPRAVEFSGHIATSAYNNVKGILTKLVDNVQFVRDIEKTTGAPATLKDVLDGLEKSLNDDEKKIVNDIKIKLGY